ncbi:hypothetical protein SPRG_13969 [Saprolegnia parasitica CBS 223.65]|uniref:Uncharacterized protein n=1 Tax=Saprolegnia parasitica (strain CBS 223.65) TaxID=695850 RepID=A0A067BPG2_SAPPC|nr:hypothetical protein SPRG_13969 [Saprolegnia parasitica CBS 223.65]KDO20143.1 hypothetical protein SPRG_13969 [Saprolegnia parasitica CBS 223.65]|eukprot:XP_012209137.1 hypothetical protein SPRG_13969 [Saprolegnia parasitica CBS 223.65]
MATLGHVLLQRQALPQARSLLERVALLDELEAGPSAFVTLESLLQVATVYRYMDKFEAAMNVVMSVVATAEVSFAATRDDVWEDLLHSGWLELGVLHCCLSSIESGCNYIFAAFQGSLELWGPQHDRPWTAFAAWCYFSARHCRFDDRSEARKLVAGVSEMPAAICDWPSRVCATCAHRIAGPVYSTTSDVAWTYLRCGSCVATEGRVAPSTTHLPPRSVSAVVSLAL